MRGVLVDSSAFLSLEDPTERSHADSARTLRELVSARTRLLSTNFVFDEAYTLILTRLGRARAVRWGESFRAGKLIELLRVDDDHERRAWEIIVSFDDKDFSYTDATSFAVTESIGIEEAFSLDRHFREFGRLRVLPPPRP
jgi:predicted nucleic acid-binding protein